VILSYSTTSYQSNAVKGRHQGGYGTYRDWTGLSDQHTDILGIDEVVENAFIFAEITFQERSIAVPISLTEDDKWDPVLVSEQG